MRRKRYQPLPVGAERKNLRVSILFKLLACTLLPLFIVFVVLTIYMQSLASSSVFELTKESVDAQTGRASKVVEEYFETFYGFAEAISLSNVVNESTQQWESGTSAESPMKQELQNYLNASLQAEQDFLMNVWVYDCSSKEVLLHNGEMLSPSNFDASSREWYQQIFKNQSIVTTSAYTDETGGEIVTTIAAPVMNGGNIAAIVGLDLRMDTLLDNLSKLVIGDQGYITLFDSSNQIIFHPDETLRMKTVADAHYSKEMETALLNKSDTSAAYYTRNGNPYYGSVVNLPESNYTILGIIPEVEYTSYVSGITNTVLGYCVGALAIMAVIMLILGRRLTKSVHKLNTTTHAIADGQLDVSVDTSSRDEIGDLASDFSRIVVRLKEYINYINEIEQVLMTIGNGNFDFELKYDYHGEFSKVKEGLLHIQTTMSSTLKQIRIAAHEVDNGAEQVSIGAQANAQGATEQASSVEQLAASLTEVSNQINDNTHSIESVASELHNIEEAVRSGDTKMSQMLSAMNEIEENSKKVGQIIKSIEDIAFQTNILALNAAVEAARAGTAGKGFAVVADEVRSLAAKTAEASKLTAELIEAAFVTVEQGKTIAQDTADSFRVVSQGVLKVSEQTAVIEQNSELQDKAIHQTTIGVDQISSVVQTNSATAEQSAAASEELSSQARSLRELVNHFKLSKEFESDN